MQKFLFLLSDGEDVAQARMMTMDEAVEAEADRKDNDLVDPYFTWYGPFDVSNPATLRITHVDRQVVVDRHEASIH